jgi:hypothetical protein
MKNRSPRGWGHRDDMRILRWAVQTQEIDNFQLFPDIFAA